VADLARRVHDEVGDAWLLVNNAGVYLSAPFTEMPAADWEFVVGVNLWGVVHGMQAFPARDGRARQRPRDQHLLDGRPPAKAIAGGLLLAWLRLAGQAARLAATPPDAARQDEQRPAADDRQPRQR
jgi:NAD(P)-dependent dehydrogenase (short-subunit alcohol dehydrogenase family)